MARFVSALILAIAAGAGLTAAARDVVEIKLRGVYFAEPANVRVTIAVEPSPQNRKLRIEADSDTMFRSSELDLSGDNQRLYTVEFKSLPAGDYMLRAELFSTDGMIGMAEQELIVAGRP